MLAQIPTDIVKNDLHSDVVIGIHLLAPGLVADDVKSLVGVFARAYSAGTELNERRGEALADLLVTVDTSKYSVGDYGKAKELITVGYQAAASNSKTLMRYSLSDADWNSYLSAKNARRHQVPGILTAIRVEGESPSVKRFVEHDLSSLKDKKMDPQMIAERLTQVQADGSVETRFETFAPADPQSKQRPIPLAPDTGLLVQFRPVATGPPFLLFGPELSAETSNVTRGIFAARFIDQNLGGYGSELRADIQAGYLTHLSTEYYRRLDAQNWYIQPRLNYLREPIYIWQNQHRIAEQFDQEAGGGLDIGRTVSNQLQFHADWTAQVIRWSLVNGIAAGPSISGTAQPTFAALLDRFIEEERLLEIKSVRPGQSCEGIGELSYSTASSYLSNIKRIRAQWGTTRIVRMKPMKVQEWLKSLDLAPKTKGHIKAVMHRLFEKAMLWELVEWQRNPMQLVEIKGISKRQKRPVILTLD
jgi:NTE family protein